MGTLERLFFSQADKDEIIQNYGVIPTDEVKRRVVSKLAKFGLQGLQGFDMATKTFSIMGGHSERLLFLRNVDGNLQEFPKLFDFPEPRYDICNDHGLHDGYTYGLNVLSRTLPIELVGYNGPDSLDATNDVRVVAKHRITGSWLLAKRVNRLPDEDIDFGYEEMPSNIESISGYLILPESKAIDVIQNSVSLNLV